MDVIKIKYYWWKLTKKQFLILFTFFLCFNIVGTILFTILPINPSFIVSSKFLQPISFLFLHFNYIWFLAIIYTVIEGQFFWNKFTKKQVELIEQQKRIVNEKNFQLNQQNEEIKTQKDEIEAQRDEIIAQRDLVTQQKNQIERIHHEISQSINYATRIQAAILPELTLLENYISEYFLLFKPKDKVSGDFYWCATVKNYLIITVADCTGHGVPGAFMSMLGTSFLREIVLKGQIIEPALILNRLREEIVIVLKQKGKYSEQKDGMDMALVAINIETLEVQLAGANNPIYLIKNCVNKIKESSIEIIKADQMPVAIYENMELFTNHKIILQKGDCLYLLSDGYQDQFGGIKRKKFLSKNLREILISNYQKSMPDQKVLLEKTIDNWKGNSEQTDDITLLGIRL